MTGKYDTFTLYLLYLLNFFTQSRFAIMKEKGVSAALTCEWRDDKWSRAARDHYIQARQCASVPELHHLIMLH